MARFKVVVTDQVFPSIEIERAVLASVGADLFVADGTPEGVAHSSADADALLNTFFPIDGGLIRRLSRCRVIARYGIGLDNIDLAAARAAGITVTHVPDYCLEEVASHALAMILSLVRRLPQADDGVRRGQWGIGGIGPIRRFSTLTIGLVGLGRIARELARSASALGAHMIAHDPYVAPASDLPPLVPLDDLARQSDVISIHAPLTPETRGLFNSDLIRQMKPGAILVNTSRGPLVVLSDLTDALRRGHLGGAGLDVFEHEPPDPGSIHDVPNLIVSPHMAYYSEDSLKESQRKAATQVAKVLTGQPPDYPAFRQGA
jgi:D-3-phosphoglycerate dehydrogenase